MTLLLHNDGTFRSLTNHHEGHHWHPERRQVSVGVLLQRHGNPRQRHLGKLLSYYGPNPCSVGAHRQDTRRWDR